jgi:hypothetical protein
MLKTRLFSGSLDEELPNAVEEYRMFIEHHSNIDIVSVNVLKYDWILLTYKQ